MPKISISHAVNQTLVYSLKSYGKGTVVVMNVRYDSGYGDGFSSRENHASNLTFKKV